MSKDQINQSEIELLKSAVEKIVLSEVLENEICEQLPITAELADSNKVITGKVSMLFVDMRESTKLPDKFSPDQLVKIYRSYIRTIVQAIRYSGGYVRDFMGDGVLAVFIDDDNGKAEDKAVHAARYITTVVDKVLNPILDKNVKHRISCGIGIHTGIVSLSKVGMRGKEQQEDAENEFGIAWIGNSTNLACKFCGAVENGTIFISASTYTALTDLEEKQRWKWIEVSKGKNVLSGYLAEKYYLMLAEELEARSAESQSITMSLLDELKQEYERQMAELVKKSEELGKKEQQLNKRAAELNDQGKALISKKQDMIEDEYTFHLDVIRSAHCKEEYTKEMGVDFWEDHLSSTIEAGKLLGKDEDTVKQIISYAMVYIYKTLELWEKAYDYLVEQAKGYAWLSEIDVKRIVQKVGYCERLKSALYQRLANGDLDLSHKSDFEKIKNWLVFDYKG
ncbi:MAG: hypothetical protein IJ418_03080 [Clostridia bacterium]|nr:hypothetical protein [Clostridia bacterium]